MLAITIAVIVGKRNLSVDICLSFLSFVVRLRTTIIAVPARQVQQDRQRCVVKEIRQLAMIAESHRTVIINKEFLPEVSMYGGADMTRYRLRTRYVWLAAMCIVPSACASSEQTRQLQKIAAKDIAKAAGCTRDEVAICIEIDCQPEEYQCAPRSAVLDLFKAREFRHR